MALVVPPPNDRKRVKVYELRNNDWFDRGTGFCVGHVANNESKICVEAEDHPDRTLLETRITKDDGYQKQQDTLIVWTEVNGTDMALSFQEAEGCAAIWEFVSQVQQHLLAIGGPDDALSDDAMENFTNPVLLPNPELASLADIDQMMRAASSSPQGRDSLSKFVLAEDYIRKIVPLVSMAEDLEALPELHKLSNIMKMLILLNDTQIIEHVVHDDVVLGVVGALEYDHEFPNHKANHRRYLTDPSRFKEVVPIEDPLIKRKIHSTWRLQYLKDVVLARILDDPTFSVLNSLIFFNQVDIVSHLQANTPFLKELFGIIDSPKTEIKKKKDAVCFIQQCCAIAKNLQAPARATLYSNFIQNGLLNVITFALLHREASIRVAGTDILVAMIDHDPAMMRTYIFKAITEKKTPLTDTLIELLLIEVDLGVKAQAADAIKVLLDPQNTPPPPPDGSGRANTDFLSKLRGNMQSNPQTESFIQNFYDESAKKLFQPLKNLENRKTLRDLNFQEISLFSHLVEILMFLIRQHLFRSKYFILTEGLAARIAQLLSCPQKHLKLTALKFFRTCIGLQDEFYNQQITKNNLFEPILNIVYDTMPRDNLLNSACLEMFEYIKRENLKPIITHVVEKYREKLKDITYVETFQNLILRYDQMQGYHPEMDSSLFSQDDRSGTPKVRVNGNSFGNRGVFQGVKDMDPTEEEYFNTSDDEDELVAKPKVMVPAMTNGFSSLPSPSTKPLVDYPDDDDELLDTPASQPDQGSSHSEQGDRLMSFLPDSITLQQQVQSQTQQNDYSLDQPEQAESATKASLVAIKQSHPNPLATAPPERLSEKRRREEDEDDELNKMSSLSKRRSSNSSISSVGSTTSSGSPLSSNPNPNNTHHHHHGGNGGGNNASKIPVTSGGAGGGLLRRKTSFHPTTNHNGQGKDSISGAKKIAISLNVSKSAIDAGGGEGGGGNGR